MSAYQRENEMYPIFSTEATIQQNLQNFVNLCNILIFKNTLRKVEEI